MKLSKKQIKEREKTKEEVSEVIEETLNQPKVKEMIKKVIDVKFEMPNNMQGLREKILEVTKLETKTKIYTEEEWEKIKTETGTICYCGTKLVEITEMFAGYEKGEKVCPKHCCASVDDYIAYELKKGNLPILPERNQEEVLRMKEEYDKKRISLQVSQQWNRERLENENPLKPY